MTDRRSDNSQKDSPCWTAAPGKIKLHCVAKMTQIWNALHCSKLYGSILMIFGRNIQKLYDRVCMFVFSCTFACYRIIVSQTA